MTSPYRTAGPTRGGRSNLQAVCLLRTGGEVDAHRLRIFRVFRVAWIPASVFCDLDMRASAKRASNNHPSSVNARRANRPHGYNPGRVITWSDSPVSTSLSEHYSNRHPAEFDAAIEQATTDGTIEHWSWSQLLGVIPPPTAAEIAEMERQRMANTDDLSRWAEEKAKAEQFDMGNTDALTRWALGQSNHSEPQRQHSEPVTKSRSNARRAGK